MTDGTDDLLDEVMETAQQYAEQRAQGASFDEAQAALKLRQAFERNGIDVDEVRYIAGDPSLMYYHDPETKTEDVVAIALVAAQASTYISRVLAVTALASETEREAHIRVEREWIDAYNAGDLSKTAYAKRVLDTWTEY